MKLLGLIVIIILICILAGGLKLYSINNFEDNKQTLMQIPIPTITKIIYEKDRTLLYGSLFLDKLNEQIKDMTDPRIKYDEKRIDIVKYSDVLM